MLRANIPTRIQLPWGTNADGSYIRSVPIPSQIGVQDGAASYNDGFPPLTMTPVAGGGKWPFGQDFNGILKLLTQWQQWQAAGGQVSYDSLFATGGYTGGYPANAILASTTALGTFWLNLVDNNTSNPDAGGANWASFTPINLVAYDGGAANAGSGNINPAPATIDPLIGYPIRIKKTTAANTGAYTFDLNSFGAKSVVHSDGSTLAAGELPAAGWMTFIYDGANYQLQSTAQAVGVTPSQLQIQSGNSAIDAGTANAGVITLAPVPSSYASILGSPIRVKKITSPNTGNYTLNANTLGAISVVHADGSQVLLGELPGSVWFTVIYDGTNFVLQSWSGYRTLGPNYILAASPGTTMLVTADCGKTVLCNSIGASALTITLPDAAVVGSGWWIRIRCGVTTLGDVATIDPFGAQTLDGASTRLFGQDTDVVIICDGANYFTAQGSYCRYSAQTTISASASFSFNHALTPIGGAASVLTEIYWVCTSTDAGYSVGDVLEGKLSVVNSVSATNTIAIVQDASGANTRVITAVNLIAPNKSTFIAANLDYTKWKLVFRCATK